MRRSAGRMPTLPETRPSPELRLIISERWYDPWKSPAFFVSKSAPFSGMSGLINVRLGRDSFIEPRARAVYRGSVA